MLEAWLRKEKDLGAWLCGVVIEPTFRKSCNPKATHIPKFELTVDPLVITLWQLHERAAFASMNIDVEDFEDGNLFQAAQKNPLTVSIVVLPVF